MRCGESVKCCAGNRLTLGSRLHHSWGAPSRLKGRGLYRPLGHPFWKSSTQTAKRTEPKNCRDAQTSFMDVSWTSSRMWQRWREILQAPPRIDSQKVRELTLASRQRHGVGRPLGEKIARGTGRGYLGNIGKVLPSRIAEPLDPHKRRTFLSVSWQGSWRDADRDPVSLVGCKTCRAQHWPA